MLTKIVLKNFRSFKEKTEFDLTESKYQKLKDTNTFNGVLKGALLVGTNASGKSNLILSIKVLMDLLFLDNIKLGALDFCLFGSNRIMTLEYQFKFDSDILNYKIELDPKGVFSFEELKLNDKIILDRKGNTARIFTNNKEESFDDKVVPNILFLKRAYFSSLFSNEPVVIKMLNYLQNSVYFNAYDKKVISYNNESMILESLPESKLEEINSFFNSFNLGFRVSRQSKQEIYSFEGENGKQMKIMAEADKPIIYLKRKDVQMTLPLEFESLGNKTLLHLVPCFLSACFNSGILLIDEFSSGFHNVLEEFLISYFMKTSKNSQIIFTSHSTNLLDTNLLRPDQIFTVDFSSTVGSTIDKFSSENPRESQNLEKMYLSGKFGGVPNYDED